MGKKRGKEITKDSPGKVSVLGDYITAQDSAAFPDKFLRKKLERSSGLDSALPSYLLHLRILSILPHLCVSRYSQRRVSSMLWSLSNELLGRIVAAVSRTASRVSKYYRVYAL